MTQSEYQTGKTISQRYIRRTAVVKVIATYIQNRILRVITSQGPVDGYPYFWMHDMMVDMVRKKVWAK